MERIQKEVKKFQKLLKEARLPNYDEIMAQIDSITRPLWTRTANSEVVQTVMDSLGDFSTKVVLPAVSSISPELAEQLDGSLQTIQKRFESMQRKQRTAPKVEKQVMRALLYDKASEGGVKLMEGIRVPKPGSEELLVKVLAAGINKIDLEKQKNQIPLISSVEGKAVGTDFCGVIEELGWWKGDKVHMFPFAVGERVFGTSSGTLAEYVVCHVDTIAYIPKDMTAEDGAALPLCGVAAYQALKGNKMQKGYNVAVIGATNGIGNLVVQIANVMGADQVIAFVSLDQTENAKSIGATSVVDIASGSFATDIDEGSINLVIDCESGGEESKSFELAFKPLLEQNGKYVSLNAAPIDKARKFIADGIGLNVQRSGFDSVSAKVTRDDLQLLASWYSEGKIKPFIGQIVNMEETELQDAFNRVNADDVKGKVIVRVSD